MDYLAGMTREECEIAKTLFDEMDGREIPATINGMVVVSRFIRNNNIVFKERKKEPTESAKEFTRLCFENALDSIKNCKIQGTRLR